MFINLNEKLNAICVEDKIHTLDPQLTKAFSHLIDKLEKAEAELAFEKQANKDLDESWKRNMVELKAENESQWDYIENYLMSDREEYEEWKAQKEGE